MAEIGVKRLAAGDHQEYRAERDQADLAVIEKKFDAVKWIDRQQHVRIVADMQRAGDRDRDEPDYHDRSKQRGHLGGAAALRGEQADQDGDRERRHVVAEGRARELQALHRRKHRNRRGDHAIAEKHRGADDADDEDERGTPPERAAGQRCERERTALPVIVGAQQDQHVFQRHGDDQRPQDQRQHAEHGVTSNRLVMARRNRRLAKGVKRAGTDIAIDDADAAERQRHETLRRFSAAIDDMGLGGSRALVHAVTHRGCFGPPLGWEGGPYIIAKLGRIPAIFRSRLTRIKGRVEPDGGIFTGSNRPESAVLPASG